MNAFCGKVTVSGGLVIAGCAIGWFYNHPVSSGWQEAGMFSGILAGGFIGVDSVMHLIPARK